MQSKTSFFNRTLFRKNLSRYWPLWGFASFVGFLAPAALLVRVIQSGETSVEPLVVREGYYYLLGNAVPIVSLVYAILCAMAVWSYLYNPRSVGMMHSLPIRREGLFLTNLLSGLAMMAIPYLVAGGLGTLLFACCGGFDAWGTLVTVLAVIAQSVTFFGLATFCAFLTGNIFALPVLYFLLNFLAPWGTGSATSSPGASSSALRRITPAPWTSSAPWSTSPSGSTSTRSMRRCGIPPWSTKTG